MGTICKVISIKNEDDDIIVFDNGYTLSTHHYQDCCEQHYWSLTDLSIEDFDGLEFDLDNNNFFERIEGYGIGLIPTNGFPIRIPAYGSNNGYYSSQLILVLNGGENGGKEFDITECQDYNPY
jgi:hypothetical protein